MIFSSVLVKYLPQNRKIGVGKFLSLMAMLCFSVFIVYGGIMVASNSNNISAYKIYKPLNGKYHPIIKVFNNKSGGGSCSAFVISDTIALTAGHCIRVDKYTRDLSIKTAKEELVKLSAQLKAATKDGNSRAAMMIQLKIATINRNLDMILRSPKYTVDEFKVRTLKNKPVNIKVKARYKASNRDFGMLKGDFSKFNKLKVETNFTIEPNDILKACGYPGLATSPKCVDFTAVGQHGFEYAGRSMLVPGMSGGPVINANGYVVGINAAARGTVSLITPTLGILRE